MTSAAKYLLDTNFVLGLLKSAPEILGMAAQRKMQANECAYSAVTRMELLTLDAGLQSVMKGAHLL